MKWLFWLVGIILLYIGFRKAKAAYVSSEPQQASPSLVGVGIIPTKFGDGVSVGGEAMPLLETAGGNPYQTPVDVQPMIKISRMPVISKLDYFKDYANPEALV